MEIEQQKLQLLNQYELLFPILFQIFGEDISVSIADTETYIKVQHGSQLVLNAKVGMKIPSGGAVYEALQSKKPISREVPKELYGIAFMSYAFPILMGNQVIGIFVMGKSLERKLQVLHIADTLAATLQQITCSVDDIAKSVTDLADVNKEVYDFSVKTTDKTAATGEVISFVRRISEDTNLLGLNASIEAARAGQQGRGFNVVAQEIRKLSVSTNESIKKIDTVLKDVNTAIVKLSSKIKGANDLVQSEAASLQDISASIEELSTMAEKMKELSSKL